MIYGFIYALIFLEAEKDSPAREEERGGPFWVERGREQPQRTKPEVISLVLDFDPFGCALKKHSATLDCLCYTLQ
jgi:hypothetical protein